MKIEKDVKPVKNNKSVKTEEKSVKGEEKRAFKHLNLELENINPYIRGQLAE